MNNPADTPETFDETTMPPEVRSAIYARLSLPQDRPALAELLRLYPSVYQGLWISQLLASVTVMDPWGDWIVDQLVHDLSHAPLAHWSPDTAAH